MHRHRSCGWHVLSVRCGAERHGEEQAGKEKGGCQSDGVWPPDDSLVARRGHRSVPLATLGWTVPVQAPGGLVLGRLEEVCADRLGQRGVVDMQGNIEIGRASWRERVWQKG